MPKIPELPPFDLPYSGDEIIVGVDGDDVVRKGSIRGIVEAIALPHVNTAAGHAAAAATSSANAQAALAKAQPDLTLIRKDVGGGFHSPCLQWWPGKFGDKAWFNNSMADIDDVAPIQTGATVVAAGGRRLAVMPNLSAGVTIMVRFRRTTPSTAAATAAPPAGCFVDFATSTNQLHNEIAINSNFTHVAGRPPLMGADFVNKMRNPNVVTKTVRRFGMERAIYSVPASGTAYSWIEGGEVVADSTTGAYVPPTLGSIGARLIAGVGGSAQALSGLIIEELIFYPAGMSLIEVERLIEQSDPDYGKPLDVPWPEMPFTISDQGIVEYDDFWYHFPTGKGWWYGRRKTAADLFRDPGNGDFTLKKMPRGAAAKGMSMHVDGSPPDFFGAGNKPLGQLIWAGWVADAGINNGRVLLEARTQAIAGFTGGALDFGGYASALGNFYTLGRPVSPVIAAALSINGGDVTRGHGVNRVIVCELPDGDLRTSINAYSLQTFNNGTAGLHIPKDLCRIGATWNGLSVLANYALRGVGIRARALTSDEHNQLKVCNAYGLPAVLGHGDSLENNAMPVEAYLMAMRRRGFAEYIPAAKSGFGGKGIGWHLTYMQEMLAYDPFFKQYLVKFWEGGLDQLGKNLYGVDEGPWQPLDVVKQFATIGSMFKLPPVWLGSNINKSYLQWKASYDAHQALLATGTATPQQIENSENGLQAHLDELNFVRAANKAIRERWPRQFVDVARAIQSASDSQAEYEGHVLNDTWPPKFFTLPDTIHPKHAPGTVSEESAYHFVGEAFAEWIIYNFLADDGWPVGAF